MSNHITIELHGTQGVAETTIQQITKKIVDCIKNSIKKELGVFPPGRTLIISRVPTKLTLLADYGNGKHHNLFMVRIYAPKKYSGLALRNFIRTLEKEISKDCEHFEFIQY